MDGILKSVYYAMPRFKHALHARDILRAPAF